MSNHLTVFPGLQVSFELNPQNALKFEDSISSITAMDKSKQARIFDNSDYANGNQRTQNVSQSHPVVN